MKVNLKFGSIQLCKALENLGFTPEKQNSTSHQKWSVPKGKKIPTNSRTFIIVVLGKKQYFPPTVSGSLRQLRSLGFTNEEIIKAFCK